MTIEDDQRALEAAFEEWWKQNAPLLTSRGAAARAYAAGVTYAVENIRDFMKEQGLLR